MNISFEIFPLPLLKRNNESLMQCVDVNFIVENINADSNIVLKVKRGSYSREVNFGKAESLNFRKEIFLPEVLSDEEAEFVFNYGASRAIKSIMFKPVRRWNVYLVLHSHTDLGFTAPISEVAKLHNDNTDVAALYCKETEHWPEGSRFKWTCEVSWQVQNYLRDRSPDQINDFFTQVRRKNIEIAGMYSGELTELLGHEQAARTFYYAAKLRREYNINIDTAMLCDVPGCTKGFVQLMAKSGIKNFIVADNNFIAPFLARTDLPRPFYWLGDDNTKVLSWYTDHPYYGYWEGSNYGLSDCYSDTRDKLPYKLAELEQSGYTYNEFQLQYAFDNFRIEFRPAAIVREWNETWEYPKLKISTAGEFLNKMRENHSDTIPERSGDWTCWWDGIVNGFPYEEAQSRYLSNKIPALETYSALLKMSDNNYNYPAAEIEKLYDDTLAFDEHSGTGMVWEAKTEEIHTKALEDGYGLIHNSFITAGKLEDKVKEQFSKLVSCNAKSVIVFNECAQERSLKVKVNIDKQDSSVTLLDVTTGDKISGLIRDNVLSFNAPNIPGIGYKVFEIIDSTQEVQDSNENGKVLINPDETILDNEYWKISVCNSTGCIRSVINKGIGKEIAAGGFNIPLVYESKPTFKIEMGKFTPEVYNGTTSPGEIIPFNDSRSSTVQVNKDETCSTGFIISHYLGGEKWLEQKISPCGDTLLFSNKIDGELINNKQFVEKYLNSQGMLYQQFSFNIKDAEIRYEAPCAVIDPLKEQFAGSCKDYYAMLEWCQLYNEEYVINFSSPDAPLIDIGEIALMKYREEFPDNPAELFIRLVTLKEITGNIKSPYVKNPSLNIRFAVSVNKYDAKFIEGEKLPSLIPAYKLGSEVTGEAAAFVIPGKQFGLLPGDSFSYFRGLPQNIQVMTIKIAEDNDDIIIRLREIIGLGSSAELTCNFGKIKEVYQTKITEEIIDKMKTNNNCIPIHFEPFAVQTIRIRFNNDN